ncbi:MAG: hypothetical protein J6T69_03605 [Methanobrevibacter sp.]|nr:hypothetical protein [Methanobrevibacter sp.]
MDYKEIQQLFNSPENIKQQILNGEVFTDEAIINICEEYNKDKSRFSPKRVNTKQVVKGYHRMLERVEKNIANENERQEKQEEKELETFLRETGLTLEEYESLTPMEKAQLKIQLEQNKHIKNMSAMQAANNIANGFDRIR